MSLKPEFFEYLEHYGRTVPLRVMWQAPNKNMIALRHDVDHDLDLALEMAYWEQVKGIQATYYLLHTASYWQDPNLLDKCLQLQDFGHEVGLHVNLLTEWFQGRINDVGARLTALLAPLRAAGVTISGIAAHGDRGCYQHHYINYWCFAELRPADPLAHEDRRCAEGLRLVDPRFQIRYPPDHTLTRADGSRWPLWSLSLQAHDLLYEAGHLSYDQYFTDSGGCWQRSDDPRCHDLRYGRYQILMHPVHWRGPRRIYFFLSTARCGSQWLSRILAQATPLRARHEFTLNHRYQGQELRPEHHTGIGFRDLVHNTALVMQLLHESHAWIHSQPGDYAEVNVYLPHLLLELRSVFGQASWIHLYRDPRAVIRSLCNRGWYTTPEDQRHPVINVPGWRTWTAFEKCCCYVGQTTALLHQACSTSLQFERMVNDPQYLAQRLQSLGIAFFPRLARKIFGQVINANQRNIMGPYPSWPLVQKAQLHYFCASIMQLLGYGATSSSLLKLMVWAVRLHIMLRRCATRCLGPHKVKTRKLVDHQFSSHGYPSALFLCRCQLTPQDLGVKLQPTSISGHAYVLLAGACWYHLHPNAGWRVRPGCYYRGLLHLQIQGTPERYGVRLLALLYNHQRQLLTCEYLGVLHAPFLRFAFRPWAQARFFNLAIYITACHWPQELCLQKLQLEEVHWCC